MGPVLGVSSQHFFFLRLHLGATTGLGLRGTGRPVEGGMGLAWPLSGLPRRKCIIIILGHKIRYSKRGCPDQGRWCQIWIRILTVPTSLTSAFLLFQVIKSLNIPASFLSCGLGCGTRFSLSLRGEDDTGYTECFALPIQCRSTIYTSFDLPELYRQTP